MASFEYTLSSGVFGLPAGSRAVDWLLLNDSDVEQSYRVTTYNVPVGGTKQPAAPGPVEGHLAPNTLTHNANSVGAAEPFSGLPIEIVVQVNDQRMLPSVEVWSDLGGTVIAGTHIGPGQFVRIS